MLTIGFYKDPALVQPHAPFRITRDLNTLGAPIDIAFFIGSVNADRQFHNGTQPGVMDITLELTDALPGAGIYETSHFKLALTQAGLDTAVAGAPLVLGTEIIGGAGNGVEVWLRSEDATTTIGLVDDEIGLNMPDLRESILGTPLTNVA